MTLSTILFAYLLGGVTFIPLLLVAIFLPAWFTLPQVEAVEDWKTAKDDLDESAAVKAAEAAQDDHFSPEGAASASFVVLRSYDFSSALAMMSAKNTTAGPAGEGGSEVTGQESVSVYQSMYRSVFDRSKTALYSKNAGEDAESPAVGVGARAKAVTPGQNVFFFIVLRHGHLMLYDSPAQLEVRHVISLAHHRVLLVDGDGNHEGITDADLFVKRTAILLDPALSSTKSNPVNSLPRPFYLFSSSCSEKEDFYHALLAARSDHPVPQPLDPACAIKLQSTLHSTSLTPETRALNALISRVFLALHRTEFAERLVRSKIERKISRVQKPSFIASLAVQSIDLGDAAPIFSNPRLKDLHISGDMVVAMDCKYNGGIKMVISAVAKLDLGSRFKVRTVDLVLAGSLQRLQGRILIHFKPPPSNRLWFTFECVPDMDIKVEPIVSSRQITYTFILRAIENRIREVVAETLVKPNWDDIPFFDTTGQTFRGGLWQQEPEIVRSEEELATEAADPRHPLSDKDLWASKTEKTMSMPILPIAAEDADERGIASGAQVAETQAASSMAADATRNMKRRSVISLPPSRAQLAPERVMATPPRTARSPSFATPAPAAPSIAMDGANIDAVKTNAAPRPNKRWIGRTSTPSEKRDVADVVREVRDRAVTKDEADPESTPTVRRSPGFARGSSEDGSTSTDKKSSVLADIQDDVASSETVGDSSMSTSPLPAASFPSAPGRSSTAKTNASTSTTSSNDSQRLRGKNLLAATAAATTAARQWTWSTVANRGKGSPDVQVEGKSTVQEPMGRGQPLPPPGIPLPKPQTQRSIWGGSVKRKPVLPARRTNTESTKELNRSESSIGVSRSERDLTKDGAEDEFGPWTENHGELGHMDADNSLAKHGRDVPERSRTAASDDVTDVTLKVNEAPPLPPRRERVLESRPRSSPDRRSSSDDKRPTPTDLLGQSDSEQSDVETSAIVKPRLPARPGRQGSFSARSSELSSFDPESLSTDEDIVALPAPVESADGELSEMDSSHVTRAQEDVDSRQSHGQDFAGDLDGQQDKEAITEG